MNKIAIDKTSPDGNVNVILSYLSIYRREMNRKRIKTPRIDKFLDGNMYMQMSYVDVCEKVRELSHGTIEVV